MITVGRGKDEEVDGDIRISRLETRRTTKIGNPEIKVMVCKDKFRFRYEKFGVKVFVSITEL